MNALIIAAAILIAVGLLISLILWVRHPGSGNSDYVTVAELQARLEDEHGHPEQAPEPDHRAGTAAGETSEEQAPDTPGSTANEAVSRPAVPAGDSPATQVSTAEEDSGIDNVAEEAGDSPATEAAETAGAGLERPATEDTPGPGPGDRKTGDTPPTGGPDRNR